MTPHPLLRAGLAALALALPSLQTSAQAVNAGQQFYQKVCAKCHETGIGPVITGRNLPAIAYVTIARNGNRAMPAFRLSDIDDATLQQLADYLASTPAQPAKAAPGAAP